MPRQQSRASTSRHHRQFTAGGMVLLTDRGGGMHGMLWDRAAATGHALPGSAGERAGGQDGLVPLHRPPTGAAMSARH